VSWIGGMVSGRDGCIDKRQVEPPRAHRQRKEPWPRRCPWFLCNFGVSVLLLRFVKNEAGEHHSLSG
jgi:hypothetical protein